MDCNSGDIVIDNLFKFIQIANPFFGNNYLKWIPYERFENIQFLKRGGFGQIYTATWIGGNIVDWNEEEDQWTRTGSYPVVLKLLDNVNNVYGGSYDEVSDTNTVCAIHKILIKPI